MVNKNKSPKIDTPMHPLRFFLIKYYKGKYNTWLGLGNPMNLVNIRSVKKELSYINNSLSLIEKINNDTVLFDIRPNTIGRPTLEIYVLLEKI